VYSTIEDSIRSLQSLKKWMRDLEEDEGLRIVGNMRKFAFGGFLFVGIRQGKYRINICDRIRNRQTVFTAGRGGEWHEFQSFMDAWKFIMPRIRHPVRAWVY